MVYAQTYAQYSMVSGYVPGQNPEMRFVDGQTILGPIQTNGHFNFQGHPEFDSALTSSNYDQIYSPTPGSAGTTSTTTVTTPSPGVTVTNYFPFCPESQQWDPVLRHQSAGWQRRDCHRRTRSSTWRPMLRGTPSSDYTNNAPTTIPGGNSHFSFAGGQPTLSVSLNSGLTTISQQAGSATATTYATQTGCCELKWQRADCGTPEHALVRHCQCHRERHLRRMRAAPSWQTVPAPPCRIAWPTSKAPTSTSREPWTAPTSIGVNAWLSRQPPAQFQRNPCRRKHLRRWEHGLSQHGVSVTDSLGLVADQNINVDAWTQAAQTNTSVAHLVATPRPSAVRHRHYR